MFSGKQRPICLSLNVLRPEQNGTQCADDTFKINFLVNNLDNSIEISLMCVHSVLIDDKPALVRAPSSFSIEPLRSNFSEI